MRRPVAGLLLASFVVAAAHSPAQAVVRNWGGGNLDLTNTTASGWNGSAPSAAGDIGNVASGRVNSANTATWAGTLNLIEGVSTSGQLRIGTSSETVFNYSDVHLNGGSLLMGSATARTLNGKVTLADHANNVIETSSDNINGKFFLGAQLTGDGGFTLQRSATTLNTGGYLVLTNAGNNYLGPTILVLAPGSVTPGGTITLELGASNVIPNTSDVHLGATSTLRIGVSSDLAATNRSEAINGLFGVGTVTKTTGTGSSTLTVGLNHGDGDFSGTITRTSGTLNFSKDGTGLQKLSGSNSYNGTTTVEDGTLQFAKQVSLYNNTVASWTATNIIVDPGATLALNVGGAGEFTSANIDTLKGLGTAGGGFRNGSFLGLDTTNASGGSFTYASAIANPNSGANTLGLTKLGTGALILTAANSYTGTTTISAGTLQVGNGGTTGSLGSGAVVNNANLVFNRNNNFTVANNISGSGSLTKEGAGTLTLSGTNSYTGATVINDGTMALQGAYTGGGNITVAAGATLTGAGRANSVVGGAGLVSPGNSPGILTFAQTNPTGGLDYAFEFTAAGNPLWSNSSASVNDVLRLTHATTPFTAALNAGNVVDVYLSVLALSVGDLFLGGFFTDRNADFYASSVAVATFNFWVLGDGSGADQTFNSVGYYSLANFDPTLKLNISTVQVPSANFSGGTVNNGWSTQFEVAEIPPVPEPGTLLLLLGGAAALGMALRRRRKSSHD